LVLVYLRLGSQEVAAADFDFRFQGKRRRRSRRWRRQLRTECGSLDNGSYCCEPLRSAYNSCDLQNGPCRNLAQSRHPDRVGECPLSGVPRILIDIAGVFAFSRFLPPSLPPRRICCPRRPAAPPPGPIEIRPASVVRQCRPRDLQQLLKQCWSGLIGIHR
jgi:hypothetical protein